MDELDRTWPDPDRQEDALARLADSLSDRPPFPGRSYPRLRPGRDTLTTQQLNVVRALAAGLNRQETAAALGIGVESVKTHLQNARRLLAAKTNPHLVAEAFRHNLIS